MLKELFASWAVGYCLSAAFTGLISVVYVKFKTGYSFIGVLNAFVKEKNKFLKKVELIKYADENQIFSKEHGGYGLIANKTEEHILSHLISEGIVERNFMRYAYEDNGSKVDGCIYMLVDKK